MNAPYPYSNQQHNLSPGSTNTNGSSEWSGMNNYDGMNRSDSPYSPSLHFNRGDLVTPPETGAFNGQLGRSMNSGYDGAPPPIPVGQGRRRPSETGSRNSSGANSLANSRSSDGTLSDQQSRKYRRMEMEVSQHYAVLRAYLKGGAPQPPRPNKARDKLLRLSPVQFHELSTDVFDELQRRQASAPLPGRPRRDQVPPFLQPRPDFHEKRNQARQKLSSLQTSRFRDLSTDVFCELERRFPHFTNMENGRRQSPGRGSRGPPPGPGAVGLPSGPGPQNGRGFVPPPRTHSAGMSISSNGGGRRGPNGSIGGPTAGGVPQFDNPPGSSDSDYGRPMPKQFQSNTMVPNKSTMVEDEDEHGGFEDRFDRSSDAFGLDRVLRDTTNSAASNRDVKAAEMQEKIEQLEAALKAKEVEVRKLEESSKSTMNSDWIEVKQDLEQKLEDAELMNQSMKDELDQLHTDHASIERDLRSKLEVARKSSSDATLKTKHEKLEQEHQDLQERLEHQQHITEEVRRQATGFLTEMREMADGGGGNLEREETLRNEVHRLEEELKEWKGRYTKTKTQLRNMRAASMTTAIVRQDASRYVKDDAFHSPTGIIRDVHITKFQFAIDELLQAARGSEPAKVLEFMKPMVLAVRSITTDIERAPPLDKDDDNAKRQTKLKSKVFTTANNVITAIGNYAAACGISPVSLLDAAASHLTVAVVELVRMVKIRPTPAGELDDDDDDDKMVEGTGKEGYFDVGKSLRRTSPTDSIYSAISTPPPSERDPNPQSGPGPEVHRNGNTVGGVAPGFGLRAAEEEGEDEEGDLEELKIYLEDQTDTLVQSIQSLVSSIRAEDVMPIVRSHINTIIDVGGNVISATEGSMDEPSSYSSALRLNAEPIVQKLEESRKKMVKAGVESQALDSAKRADGKVKFFTQGLPPLAFGIAREMKGLVAIIEMVESGAGEEDYS